MLKRYYLYLLPFVFCACNMKERALFELLPSNISGINFKNTLSEGDSLNILNYVYYYNGAGVGIADFNNDGLEDIFFSGNETSCRLYVNQGKLKFDDVTKHAGLETKDWCTGVSIADVNGDGWMDIYICTAGYQDTQLRKNLLFINNGRKDKLTFTESAASYGIADTSYSTQAAFFDFDKDGDLDLYVMNHANERQSLNTPLPKKLNGEASSNDQFYRNNGDLTFTNVSKELGITTEGYGLGIAIGDVNGDGWEDIYIANDFISNDCLYINHEGKKFSNQSHNFLKQQSYNSMGCDLADFNNDLYKDIVTVDMLPETDFGQKTIAGSMTWDKWKLIKDMGYENQYMRNTLQLSECGTNGSFNEIAQISGIDASDWSWSPLFADFDNDGWKDLFITTGYFRDITDRDFIDYSKSLIMFKNQKEADRELMTEIRKMKGKKVPNRIFQNNHDLTFTQNSEIWGMSQPTFSNGAAYADLDLDGDLDLVINNINEAAYVYENKAEKLLKNNYINLRLESEGTNREGIGAIIKIYSGGQWQTIEQHKVRGFMSSVSSIIHFGLGECKNIDTLFIQWNDGSSQEILNIKANQNLVLKQINAQKDLHILNAKHPILFEEVSKQVGINFIHKETAFNDFQLQPLLTHSFSENGPPLATGDLNNDGLEDFYIGGGKGQSGCIYLQKLDGTFTQKTLLEAGEAEDTAALIFDANNDGRNDLYIVSGSCEWPVNSTNYQDRLYMNGGNENFKNSKNALPKMTSPKSCIAATDFDDDGDLDLFIGGDAELQSYPYAARSYILKNENGVFRDVTSQLSQELVRPGIVKAAQWADIDDNGTLDLILTGEWMPITIFKNEQSKLVNITNKMGLANSLGWWRALQVCDLDSDGDLDMVAGNFGLNSKLHASVQRPLSIYADDFDHNGSMDAITCQYTDGRLKPFHARSEVLAQISGLGGKYVRYSQYAKASIQDVLGNTALSKAMIKKCNTLKSSIFIQDKGQYFQRTLPFSVQTSPIQAILCEDFNADGFIDILMTGTSNASHFLIGLCDAGSINLMMGNGKGRFQNVDQRQSGLFNNNIGNSLASIKTKLGYRLVLTGVNDNSLKVFRVADQNKKLDDNIQTKIVQ